MKQRAPLIEQEDLRAATAAALGASADAITEPWLERVGRRRDSRTYQEARATLRGLMDWLIAAIAGWLIAAIAGWLIAAIAGVGAAVPPPERVASFVQIRRRQGTDLPAIFEDVRALRDAAWIALTLGFGTDRWTQLPWRRG